MNLGLVVSIFLFTGMFLGCGKTSSQDSKGIANELGDRPAVERIIVIGDSLSDTGKMLAQSHGVVPSRKNYWQGRFSDGFVWVDYLAQHYNTTAYDSDFIINQSIGGVTAHPYPAAAKDALYKNIFDIAGEIGELKAALMHDLAGELQEFELKNTFLPSDLVIVWMGANDMLWVAEAFDPSLTQETVADNAAARIEEAVVRIQGQGGRHILVVGLPDMDLAPRFNKTPKKSAQIKRFNTAVEGIATKYQASLDIRFADTDKIFRPLVTTTYAGFGFTNVADASFKGAQIDLTPPPFDKFLDFSVYKEGASRHVFWDDVHPTTGTHAILAEVLRTEFIEPYYEITPPRAKCDYVEVRNKGAYVLNISATAPDNKCGTPEKLSLVNGQIGLVSITDATQLHLAAVLGKSVDMPIGPSENIKYRLNSQGSMNTKIPRFTQISCGGTTLIGFECEETISARP